MADEARVVTAKLPEALVLRLDEIAARLERSKSWIIRQALIEWIADEERRHELTLEGLKCVDEGKISSQEEVEAHFNERKEARRQS
jgi:predicted transcriptional regulator